MIMIKYVFRYLSLSLSLSPLLSLSLSLCVCVCVCVDDSEKSQLGGLLSVWDYPQAYHWSSC